MSQFLEQVQQAIRTRALLKRGQSLLIAVSGGVDSMVLLHALHTLAAPNRWRLTIAHLNHGLRDRASQGDERFVRQRAKQLQLPFVSQKADVRGLAMAGKISLEMAARQLRHQFLAETAISLRIPAIALAHHADDQVELFLLRLLRGAGADGLSGMKWKSPSPHDAKVRLLRPLLDQTRDQILEFAQSQRIGFREDESNLSLDHQRNRIRHQLIPALVDQHQPALRRIILRQMEIHAAESDYIAAQARAWLRSRRGMTFRKLPLALQRKVLILQLRRCAVPAGFELVERLREEPGQPIFVSPGLAVVRDEAGRLRAIESPRFPGAFGGREIGLDLGTDRGGADFEQVRFTWQFENRRGALPPGRPNCEWFDAQEVGRKVRLRQWRKGDRFQPIGMRSAVKLQDLFTNQKVPKSRRHRLIIATTWAGEIWWVEGMRIGERFKVTPRTRRRLRWEWGDAGLER